MKVIANIALTFMILLTVADVTLRSFRRPIIGTYDIVSFLGVVVMGFAIPFTSLVKGHIRVDFLVLKLPQKEIRIFNIVTRCIGTGLFLIIGWNLLVLGKALQKAGEVSSTISIPLYPAVYGLGICCLIESLVVFCDIFKAGGKNE
jgi:TRAP-type C4-dicarboxylate transport system permease small subunit